MQVDSTVIPFSLPGDTRSLSTNDPLRQIAAKSTCIQVGCVGEYDWPHIVRQSTHSNIGKAYQKVIIFEYSL